MESSTRQASDEEREWAASVADGFKQVVSDAVADSAWSDEERDWADPDAGRQSGTAIFTCKNHPNYRWTKTKHGPGFMGRGVLMFDGEEGGKPSSPFNMSEARLSETAPEYQEHFRERYTPECNCPISDLEFLAWA